MSGCGYNFDAAFSESPVPADASNDGVTSEVSSDQSATDAAVDGSDADAPAESTLVDEGTETQAEAEAASEDVQEDVSPCGNGEQDGDETGVDCGGSCEPCPPEVCTNQIDDDKDGETDCADDDCGQYTCVNASGVAGWTGPVMVHAGSSCDDGQPPVYSGGWDGLVNEPSCTGSTCACSIPIGQSCSPPTLSTYDDPACTKQIAVVNLSSGSCVPMMGSVDGLMVTPGVPISGSCMASGSPGTPGQVSWSIPTVVCGVGAGCSGGSCTTNPASWGNDSFLCLVREGTHTCPDGWSAQGAGGGLATTLPSNLTCSACTCGAPFGGTCPGQVVESYGSQGCIDSPSPMQANGQCLMNNDSAARWVGSSGTPQGSSCGPVIPQVQGPIEASGFVTVCCSDTLP